MEAASQMHLNLRVRHCGAENEAPNAAETVEVKLSFQLSSSDRIRIIRSSILGLPRGPLRAELTQL